MKKHREIANMITFIEKKEWTDPSLFIGQTYAPIFMDKDGVEYFVVNRVVRGGTPNDKNIDEIKAFLIQNSGKYFKFYGMYIAPFDMLKEMTERGHTFRETENDLFDDCRDYTGYGRGFVDFHGNRNEVSAAFCYRIYDSEMIRALQKAVKPLIKRGKQ